ncbi:hypothetical protein F4776DRAFT_418699 [Hypoxylon sp. NC0597]|nr:hypothetical protein F4776DRAFT_418699 [Hypoxylon sp. NC0597]
MASGTINEIPEAILNETSPEKAVDIVRARINKLLDEYTKYIDDTFDITDSMLKEIVDQWHDKTLSFTKPQFTEQICRLEEKIRSLAERLVIVKASRQTLLGCLVDNELWKGLYQNGDREYIELLVTQCRSPLNPQRTLFRPESAAVQESFRTAIFDRSGMVIRKSFGEDKAWCAVSGTYHRFRCIKAAHFTRNLGEIQARYLFGQASDSRGHIMSLQNGIPMHISYQKLLDEARITLFPVAGKGCWRILVLDKTIQEAKNQWKVDPWGMQLDGRDLQFPEGVIPPSERPYFYFSFCVNILRRQRYEAKGWWRNVLRNYDKTIWTPCGTNYIRASTLKYLALRIGHLDRDEVDSFVEKIWVNSSESVQPGPGVSLEDMDKVVASCLLNEEIGP